MINSFESLAAVKEDPYSLEYASEELKKDREVVLAAITQDGWVLGYASKELQNDQELIAISM